MKIVVELQLPPEVTALIKKLTEDKTNEGVR